MMQPCMMSKLWTGASGNGHKSFLSSQESFLRGGTVSMYRFAMQRQMMMPVMFPIVSHNFSDFLPGHKRNRSGLPWNEQGNGSKIPEGIQKQGPVFFKVIAYLLDNIPEL